MCCCASDHASRAQCICEREARVGLTVVAKVQFTAANGVRWETPTKGAGIGEPVRL